MLSYMTSTLTHDSRLLLIKTGWTCIQLISATPDILGQTDQGFCYLEIIFFFLTGKSVEVWYVHIVHICGEKIISLKCNVYYIMGVVMESGERYPVVK